MNHIEQVQKLWKLFRFVLNASDNELMDFGFKNTGDDLYERTIEVWLDEEEELAEPSFYIFASRINGITKVLVQTSFDGSSYQLAGGASFLTHRPETNMISNFDQDTVTIRASNTGDATWIRSEYGTANSHLVNRTNEAEMFQIGLIVNVPSEYIDIQSEMIQELKLEAELKEPDFDKIVISYTYPIVDLHLPDVPEKNENS